jgi:signal transduction histidine kinase
MNNRAFFLSALIGGLVMGLLANLPLLNLINCFLCFWIWLGAIFAVFLYTRFAKGEPLLSVGQGAGLGAVAGVIAAVFGALVFALTNAISLPMMNSLANFLQVEGMPSGQGGFWEIAGLTIFFTCLNIVLYPLFGAIGGLIASGLFWKKPQVDL